MSSDTGSGPKAITVPSPSQNTDDSPAFTFSHLATWVRVLTKVGTLRPLPFIIESHMNIGNILKMQNVLIEALIPELDKQIKHGNDIFLNTQPPLFKIYNSLLASKAAYTLAEHLTGSTDPHAILALSTLTATHTMHSYNYNDFSLLQHPRDSMLFEPKEPRKEGDFWVFAVKGTATTQDWVDDFDAGSNPFVHSNLVHQGELLYTAFNTQLTELLDKKERIVFTGHSAGAAVVSYLYEKLYNDDYNMDCIVFAPPAMSREKTIDPIQLSSLTRHDPTLKHNLQLAFCNRYDPVPRATTTYVQWFLDSWRSLFTARLTFHKTFTVWPPPMNVIIPFGEIVGLEEVGGACVASWFYEDEDSFNKTIYLDPTKHPMDRYVRNVLLLLKQSGFEKDLGGLLPVFELREGAVDAGL